MAGVFFLKKDLVSKDLVKFEHFRSIFHDFFNLYELYKNAIVVEVEDDFRIDKQTSSITDVEDYAKIVSMMNDKRHHLFSYFKGDKVKVPQVSDILGVIQNYPNMDETEKLPFTTDSLNEFKDIEINVAQTLYQKYQHLSYIPITSLEQAVNGIFEKILV